MEFKIKLYLIVFLIAQQAVMATEVESETTVVYSNKPQTIPLKVNSSDFNKNQRYKSSQPIQFDILQDEKIGDMDPRIKSISYVINQSSANYVQIAYTNPNASNLAMDLAVLLHKLGIKVLKPVMVNSVMQDDLKYVVVYIRRYQINDKPKSSIPIISKTK